jgi:hemoglobin
MSDFHQNDPTLNVHLMGYGGASSAQAIHVPPSGPPHVNPPDPAIYAAMGEAGVFALLEAFYAELARSSIAAMFPRTPEGLKRAAHKSATFFVGVVGGPPLYQQRYGNPAMRARHMPFVITEEGRLEWLRCFDVALARSADFGFPPEHLDGFRTFLDIFSGWMVNSAEEGVLGAAGPYRRR